MRLAAHRPSEMARVAVCQKWPLAAEKRSREDDSAEAATSADVTLDETDCSTRSVSSGCVMAREIMPATPPHDAPSVACARGERGVCPGQGLLWVRA